MVRGEVPLNLAYHFYTYTFMMCQILIGCPWLAQFRVHITSFWYVSFPCMMQGDNENIKVNLVFAPCLQLNRFYCHIWS